MANIGLNVVEVDGKATPSIQPAPTSVAAFLIIAPKGVKDRVEPITNWTEFLEAFGGYMESAYGAYAVRGFFDNGGSRAYITRLIPSNARASSVKLPDSTGNVALTVQAGERGITNPGPWGDDLSIQIIEQPASDGMATTYTLKVKLGDVVVETWDNLSNSDSTDSPGKRPKTEINDDLRGSQYIVVTEEATTNPAPTINTSQNNSPKFEDLINGDVGSFTLVPQFVTAVNDALPLFDVYDVQLVCCPESDSKGVAEKLLTYCDNRGDCMAVCHTPKKLNAIADIKKYVYDSTNQQDFDLRGTKRYGALYWPWIQVFDPLNGRRWIPPTGHVMGVYARTERERGIWKAPAGNAARLNGVLAVEKLISDADHTDLVKNGSINAIRPIPGLGIVIDSSRTLSTSPLWYYVNVRLLFNFVKSSLKAGLRWTVQEPNDEALWNKVKYNSVTPFLMGLWRRGAFGPGAAEDVFTVKIDAENNRPEDIQSGRLNVEVYFYPSRPAETILITVGQQEGAASASES